MNVILHLSVTLVRPNGIIYDIIICVHIIVTILLHIVIMGYCYYTLFLLIHYQYHSILLLFSFIMLLR